MVFYTKYPIFGQKKTKFRMSDNLVSFGVLLRQLRAASNLPLRKVAAELDIDLSLLAKIERDERQASKEILQKIASFFKQDEHKLTVTYLSDIIAYKVMEEEYGIEILKVAEQKIKYLKKNDTR